MPGILVLLGNTCKPRDASYSSGIRYQYNIHNSGMLNQKKEKKLNLNEIRYNQDNV